MPGCRAAGLNANDARYIVRTPHPALAGEAIVQEEETQITMTVEGESRDYSEVADGAGGGTSTKLPVCCWVVVNFGVMWF